MKMLAVFVFFKLLITQFPPIFGQFYKEHIIIKSKNRWMFHEWKMKSNSNHIATIVIQKIAEQKSQSLSFIINHHFQT